MKIITSQKYNNRKKELALDLLKWTGYGASHALSQVAEHWRFGEDVSDGYVMDVIKQLENIANKKVPSSLIGQISDQDIAEVRNLQSLVRQEMNQKENSGHYTPDTPMGLNDDNPVSGFDY